jgi:cytochrome c2
MVRVFLALWIPVLLLTACGRGAVVQPAAPTQYVPPRSATSTAESQQATQRAAEATATPEPGSAAALPGDPAAGEVLFVTFQAQANFACNSCHHAASEDRLIGPGLLHVGQRAATRVEGQSAEEYLRNSILHPNDYVVPDYPANLMPLVYVDIFTEEEVNNLVAYLLTL